MPSWIAPLGPMPKPQPAPGFIPVGYTVANCNDKCGWYWTDEEPKKRVYLHVAPHEDNITFTYGDVDA